MIRELIRDTLKKDEGLRLSMYEDTVGVPTIGYGHNLQKAISLTSANQILEDDIEDALKDARRFYWFESLNDARQCVLVMLIFNMGFQRLQGFVKFLSAAENHNYIESANELRDSKWYGQVGKRAERLCQIWLNGTWR